MELKHCLLFSFSHWVPVFKLNQWSCTRTFWNQGKEQGRLYLCHAQLKDCRVRSFSKMAQIGANFLPGCNLRVRFPSHCQNEWLPLRDTQEDMLPLSQCSNRHDSREAQNSKVGAVLSRDIKGHQQKER